MAGDIKSKYVASASFTFTSANSLAGSSTWVAGAMSAPLDIATNLWLDIIVGGLITWSSTAPASGTSTYLLEARVYGSINDTPTYPKDGSGNNMGSDAALTFASADDKNNATQLLNTVVLAATASKVYTLKPMGVAALFGGPMPNRVGLFVTHGVTTASSTINASGNTWSYTPILAQYT